jgi:hypothetical protein
MIGATDLVLWSWFWWDMTVYALGFGFLSLFSLMFTIPIDSGSIHPIQRLLVLGGLLLICLGVISAGLTMVF